MRRKNSIAIVFGFLAATLPAHAGVVVTGEDCGGFVPACAYRVVPLGDNHFNVFLLELYAPFLDSFFEIHPTSPGTIIDNVFIDIDGPPAGSPVIVRVSPNCVDLTLKFQAVQNIVQLGTAETLLNLVDVDGDVGSITVLRIGIVRAGGDITGPIIATTLTGAINGMTVVNAVGNILGDLRADNGRIGFVTAQTGDIGTPANPITVQCKFNITNFSSTVGNVYANINTRFNGGQGTLTFFQAQTFDGTLVTSEILNQIRVDVELAADITIGGSFDQPTFMDLEPGGLTGQIIVNADNRGAVWDASIFLGDPAMPEIELTGQGYTETAESIGGGSVGLAPFELHDESCEPPNSVPTLLGPSLGEATVKLRHYGPVMLAGSAPLTFERRLRCTADPFVLLPAADFDVMLDPADSNSLIVTGAMGAPGFEEGFEYRIQPDLLTEDLKCDQVVGNPPVAWDGPYHMIVGSTCDADTNGDGVVNVLDLIDLLLCFGQPAIPGCEAEDINCDGVVDVLDLIALLLVFGELCEGGESAQGGGSDELQLGLEQLGWDSWQEWVNDLRQLDPGGQTACVLQVLGVVCGHD